MKKILHILTFMAALYALIVVTLSIMYIFVPPISTLMLTRWVTLEKVHYTPVSLSRVSPALVRMVMRAEDSQFCVHHGVDWHSLGHTIEDATEDGPTRGASTIAMQVTKNLFLWPQQSYIRKAIEIPMAMYLSALWSKKRMMENYLSIAEWGNGIFGIEAASQNYFHKSARALSWSQAAFLAAALPNPRQRNPNNPSAYHLRYATNLMKWGKEDMDMSCLH